LAREIWDRLLAGSRDGEQIAGLELLTRLPDERMRPHLVRLMRSPSDRVRRAALRALAGFPSGALNELAPALTELYESDDPEIRALCVAGSRVLDSESCRELCLRALEDPHPGARDQALVLLEQVEGRSQAVEIVCRWVLENRGFPRAQQSALSALSRYRLPREVFERIAESKVSEACMLARATRIIRQESGAKTGGDPVMELLGVVMQERVRQIVDLALMAMENFEDRKAIAAIRAGVASRDRRHVAHACEALHTMCCHRLAGPLVALVDNTGYAKHETDDKQEHAFQNSRDVIGWCIRHPDAWLRECAARAIPAPHAEEVQHG
jgi:HEAT repeat protein